MTSGSWRGKWNDAVAAEELRAGSELNSDSCYCCMSPECLSVIDLSWHLSVQSKSERDAVPGWAMLFYGDYHPSPSTAVFCTPSITPIAV